MTSLDDLWPDPERRDAALARLQARVEAGYRGELTEREHDCLRAASMGLDSKSAAILLGLSSHTVDHHLVRARRVLRAKNTTHAVALAIRHGLIP